MPQLNNAKKLQNGLTIGTRTLKQGEVYYARIGLRGGRRNTVKPIIGAEGTPIEYENGAAGNERVAERLGYQLFLETSERWEAAGTIKAYYLHKLADEYLKDCKSQYKLSQTSSKPIPIEGGKGDWSYNHWCNTRIAIKHYIIPYFEDKHRTTPIEKITTLHIEAFQAWRGRESRKKGKNYSPSTNNKHNQVLRHIFKFAQRKGALITDRPIVNSETETLSERRFVDFSQEELDLLIKIQTNKANEYANDLDIEWFREQHIYRNYMLHWIHLCSLSGIRPNTNIKHEDIKQGKMEGKNRIYITRTEKGKTRNAFINLDFIPIHEKLLQFKKEMGLPTKDSDWLYSHPNEKRTAKGIIEAYSRVDDFYHQFNSRKALHKSLKDKVPYSLRHYYITQAIYDGKPISAIAKQCGTSVEMIEKTYMHLIIQQQAELFS